MNQALETNPSRTDERSKPPPLLPSLDYQVWRRWRLGERTNVREIIAQSGVSEPAEIVGAMCVDQRERWLIGEPISVERYFESFSEIDPRSEHAFELVYCEFLVREDAGEPPTLDEYAERFPQFADRLKIQVDLHRSVQESQPPRSEATTPFWDDTSSARPCAGSAATRAEATRDATWPAVPDHEIVGILGRGGMGVVYKARQIGLNRWVALKMLAGAEYAGPEQFARFRTEAAAAARLHHPHITQIHQVGEHNGCPYFSMELVDGPSLAQRLDGTHLDARQAATLTRTLAEAIHYAHEHGVVHRDLKPSNILLSFNGEPQATARGHSATVPDTVARHSRPLTEAVACGSRLSEAVACGSPLNDAIPKITDFGLAKVFVEDRGDRTESGAILGTPSYMSPEQAAGQTQAIGPATDVYTLGAILYELLSGRPPFKAQTPLDTLQQVRNEDPISPSRLQPTTPRELETICLKCLAKKPHKRYGSARALAEDLERFLNDQPIHARRSSPLERAQRWCRRNPVVASLTALVASLLVAVTIGSIAAATRFRSVAAHEKQTADDLLIARDEAVTQRQRADNNAKQIQLSMERLERSYRLLESGDLARSKNQWRTALADYSEAVTLRRDSPLVWIQRGQLYGRLHLWDRAASDYATSFDLHLNSEASLWAQHAQLRLYVGDTASYDRICPLMLQKFAVGDPRTDWWLASVCTFAPSEAVDTNRALQCAQSALWSEPKSISYLSTLGAAHYRAGQYDAAVERLREATQFDYGWTNSEAIPLLAMAYARLGQANEARHWLDNTLNGFADTLEAVRHHPFDCDTRARNKYDFLAVYLFYRKAQEVVGISPPEEHPIRWIVQARGHAALGQLDEAAEYFDRAVERWPEHAQARLCRANFHTHLAQWDKAIADLAKAVELVPEQSAFWCEQAGVLLLAGEDESYRRLCSRMLERFGDATDNHSSYCTARAVTYGPNDAEVSEHAAKLSQYFLQDSSSSPWQLHNAGLLQYRIGQFERAIELFNESLAVRPEWIAIVDNWLGLALAHHRLGDTDEVREWLDNANRWIDENGQQVPQGGLASLPFHVHDWIGCMLLRREAEALFSQ